MIREGSSLSRSIRVASFELRIVISFTKVYKAYPAVWEMIISVLAGFEYKMISPFEGASRLKKASRTLKWPSNDLKSVNTGGGIVFDSGKRIKVIILPFLRLFQS